MALWYVTERPAHEKWVDGLKTARAQSKSPATERVGRTNAGIHPPKIKLITHLPTEIICASIQNITLHSMSHTCN